MFARSVDRAFRRYQRSGDADSIAFVFDHTASLLLRLAHHLAPRGAAAEDLLQATFLSAIESRDKYDAAQPVLPWLIGILANHARVARRQSQRLPDPHRLRYADNTDPAEQAEESETRQVLDQAIDRLPEAYRAAVRLHLQRGLDPAEIAHTLGRRHGTVRAQLHRGLQRLRRLLPVGLGAAGTTAVVSAQRLAAVRAVVVRKAGQTAPSVLVANRALVGAPRVAVAALSVASLTLLWMPVGRVEAPAEQNPTAASVAPPEQANHARDRAAEEPKRDVLAAGEPSPDSPPSPRGSLRVRVFGPEGAPLAGVRVAAPTSSAWMNPRLRAEWSATDTSGAVVFRELDPERYVVAVDRRGPCGGVEVVADAETVHDVHLSGLRIEGQVVDDAGVPRAGATIWARCGSVFPCAVAVADASGRFWVDHVREKTELMARAPGHAPSPAVIARGPEGSTQSVRLTLAGPGCTVTGLVMDPDGRPLVGASVFVIP